MTTADAISPWESPEHPIRLERDEVHVWRARVPPAASDAVLKLAGQVLRCGEVARAERFRQHDDRLRFLLGRVMVRCLLAEYLATRPDQLVLQTSVRGKPMLEPGQGIPDLRFNLAHSGEWVLLVVACERHVGVDVERWRPDLDVEALATRFFARGEADALFRLPREMRTRAFFDCWVRKEAYVKGTGEGLSARLDEFEVSLEPDQPACLLRVGHAIGEDIRWRLQDLPIARGYSAALAVDGPGWRLCRYEWFAPHRSPLQERMPRLVGRPDS